MSMDEQRRRLLRRGFALAGSCVAGAFGLGRPVAGAAQAPVIRITARRFFYSPNEIVLQKGQTAVLEITALDFMHGFHIPELKMRADLPPGRLTTLRVRFDQPGSYDFLCDNFCGEGHEKMAGHFRVTE